MQKYVKTRKHVKQNMLFNTPTDLDRSLPQLLHASLRLCVLSSILVSRSVYVFRSVHVYRSVVRQQLRIHTLPTMM